MGRLFLIFGVVAVLVFMAGCSNEEDNDNGSPPAGMVLVPAGEFIMGNTPDGYGEPETAHPGNPVWVDDFYIDIYEVTNLEFAAFLNALTNDSLLVVDGGYVYDSTGTYAYLNIGTSASHIEYIDEVFEVIDEKDNHPIGYVSWYGAVAYAEYCDKRLPSEAEWEKAARGISDDFGESEGVGVGYIYPWVSSMPYTDYINGSYANYSGSGDPWESASFPRTTPVGLYDGATHEGFATSNNASYYGAFDMVGNVWEWVEDWHGDYQDPHSPPETGIFKAIRGGGWSSNNTDDLFCTKRNPQAPNSMVSSIGFRCAKDK